MVRYRTEHKEEIRASRRAHYLANREKQINAAKAWAKAHPEIQRQKNRKYRAKPGYQQRHNKYLRLYRYKKRREDSQYKLKEVLRARLNRAIRGHYKSGSSVDDLGCTISEFREYIEASWRGGMTWENWSRAGWHIDHIKPLASFDLTDRKQLLEAVHYTNLQPLWAIDNLRKRDK